MKWALAFALTILVGGCSTQQRHMSNLSITMLALNQEQPFVSAKFAERLALLVIEDRYPNDFFLVQGPATIVDKGGVWLVTFDNALISQNDKSALPLLNGRLAPRRLTITIQKENGAIVDFS